MAIHFPVEICIHCTDPKTTAAAVIEAHTGGAQRLELCSRMDVDGLTPGADLVATARYTWGESPGLLAMIRPRPGNFTYSAQEVDGMADQIAQMALAGANGVVLGAVRDGRLDEPVLAPLVAFAHGLGLSVTCHRAFDAVSNSQEALDLLAKLGVDRVLTSGTPWGSGRSVAAGVDRLIALRRHADPGLEMVLGGGVSPATIAPVLARLMTLGVDEGPISVHAYSSVLKAGQTYAPSVAQLVAATFFWSP